MITIISPGFRNHTFYYFECKKCGCKAEVTKDELWPYSNDFVCPYCKNLGPTELSSRKVPLEIEGVKNGEFPFILMRGNEKRR